MTLEQDWERLYTAYWVARKQSAYPDAHIFVRITELRKTDNKGIDFVIRRLYADPEYKKRIRLYGAPPSRYPRYPLRVTHNGMFGYKEYHYDSISIKETSVRTPITSKSRDSSLSLISKLQRDAKKILEVLE